MSKAYTIPENDILKHYRTQALLTDPSLIELSQLDMDMSRILNQTHLSSAEKAMQYYTVLQRYRNLYANLLRESGDATSTFTQPAPTTPSPITAETDNIKSSLSPTPKRKESTLRDDTDFESMGKKKMLRSPRTKPYNPYIQPHTQHA